MRTSDKRKRTLACFSFVRASWTGAPLYLRRLLEVVDQVLDVLVGRRRTRVVDYLVREETDAAGVEDTMPVWRLDTHVSVVGPVRDSRGDMLQLPRVVVGDPHLRADEMSVHASQLTTGGSGHAHYEDLRH